MGGEPCHWLMPYRGPVVRSGRLSREEDISAGVRFGQVFVLGSAGTVGLDDPTCPVVGGDDDRVGWHCFHERPVFGPGQGGECRVQLPDRSVRGVMGHAAGSGVAMWLIASASHGTTPGEKNTSLPALLIRSHPSLVLATSSCRAVGASHEVTLPAWSTMIDFTAESDCMEEPYHPVSGWLSDQQRGQRWCRLLRGGA